MVRFDLLNENLATIKTSGVDLDATYTFGTGTGVGELQVDWLLNWVDEYVETTRTGAVRDRTGLTGRIGLRLGNIPRVAFKTCRHTGKRSLERGCHVSLSR